MRKNFGAKPYLYPQPVLIIGTYNEDGTSNAMNAAWGGLCGVNKIMIDLANHKSTNNIIRNGEFTVSIADADHVLEADYVGIVSGEKVPNKLEVAGLHTVKSEYVNAPIIEEFPMTFECQLLRQTEDGIIGKIINVNIDERVLNEKGTVDIDKLGAITLDAMNLSYIKLGEKVGNAFSDGKKLVK